VKIKLGPEQLSVNGKTVPIMPLVLSIVAQYNAEIQETKAAYNTAKQNLDEQLKKAQNEIETRYEQMLLGAYKP
jgi:flagellar capping protein FliD